MRMTFPHRVYYGWWIVLALSITETVSYGILYYAFTVFIAPMQAELDWSRAEITAGLSLALLVAGIAALPVGRWVDRHGSRGLMTLGSLIAALVVLAWAGVQALWFFYLLCSVMGLAMAAVLYEPAFATRSTRGLV